MLKKYSKRTVYETMLLDTAYSDTYKGGNKKDYTLENVPCRNDRVNRHVLNENSTIWGLFHKTRPFQNAFNIS